MLKVALTGGIGSGKSTVAEMLEECGAIVIDSDQLAREVIERGTPGYDSVLKAFGDEILLEGEIDRIRLAEIVFKDETKRQLLESIIHPLVRERAESLMRRAPNDSVIVNQIPLLVETEGAKRFDYIITVSTTDEIRRQRLLDRGMKDYEISKRMAAQVDDAAREAIAHHVLTNNGSRDQLQRSVEDLWSLHLKPKVHG